MTQPENLLRGFVSVILLLVTLPLTAVCQAQFDQLPQLPQLPDSEGFAGSFAGTHNGALIVAGGANFPNKMPWDGGEKVWYDRLFVLESPEGDWTEVGKLPRPIGYGVSISTPEGVVCIGGSDAKRHYNECFRLQWQGNELRIVQLPSLPSPRANACGALLDGTIYVAGGVESPTATNTLKEFWSLELTDPKAQWQELEPWPGPARMLATAAAQDQSFFLCSGTDLKPGADGKPVRQYLRDAYRYRPGSGWKRIADLPRAAVASPTPAPVVGKSMFCIVGGDDGSLVDFQPPEKHPGFPKSILAYDTALDRWQNIGEVPAGHVTTTAIDWRSRVVIPSGEVRPGKRSPVVLSLQLTHQLETVDLFPPGMNGIARYRIPGMVVTSKGTVLAYCEARKNSSSDWGEIEVHLRRSVDGGKTWLPSQQIAHHAERIEGNPRKAVGGEREQTVNNPVAIVDRQSGAIEFLYCINYARCFSMRSTDDGLTWSQPIEITNTFEPFRKQYDWRVIATGPGHGIQTRSGRLIVPIWLAYGAVGDHKPSASGTIYSDDHGSSWQAGEIAFPDEGDFGDPNETTITELSDGRVMLVARSESKLNRKLIAFSSDGATGWSTPVFHEQLWEPICMASIVSYPSKPSTLIFSNPHSLDLDQSGQEKPAGRGKRKNLSIKLSYDDGKSWPINKTLDAGPSAYSDLAVLPDGTVLCLYEANQSIACARFGLSWITAQ